MTAVTINGQSISSQSAFLTFSQRLLAPGAGPKEGPSHIAATRPLLPCVLEARMAAIMRNHIPVLCARTIPLAAAAARTLVERVPALLNRYMDLARRPHGTALFLVQSCANHSCEPNASVIRHGLSRSFLPLQFTKRSA